MGYQTISCLLIQPNPDSALNATAGHLLQEDYDSFARQARLMTSIHASIPLDLRDAALAAKRRGEEPGDAAISEDQEQRPTIKSKSASSSSVIMKKHPQRIASTQSAPTPRLVTQDGETSANEEDEGSASKENDPMLSPTPVPVQIPRRPTLVKRPLSDLPTPTEPDEETTEASYLSPSNQNVLNNTFSIPTDAEQSESCKASSITTEYQAVNFTGRGLQDASPNGLAALPIEASIADDGTRPVKRICSDESKEDISAKSSLKLPERPQSTTNSVSKVAAPAPRKPSAPASVGAGSVKGKARIGLRRL